MRNTHPALVSIAASLQFSILLAGCSIPDRQGIDTTWCSAMLTPNGTRVLVLRKDESYTERPDFPFQTHHWSDSSSWTMEEYDLSGGRLAEVRLEVDNTTTSDLILVAATDSVAVLRRDYDSVGCYVWNIGSRTLTPSPAELTSNGAVLLGNGKQMATIIGPSLRVFDLATGRDDSTVVRNRCPAITFGLHQIIPGTSADGAILCLSSGSRPLIVDMGTCTWASSTVRADAAYQISTMRIAMFSDPDTLRLCTISGTTVAVDQTLHVPEVASWSVDREGKWLAYAKGGQGVWLRNVSTGEVRSLR